MLNSVEAVRPGHMEKLQIIWFGSEHDRTPEGNLPDYYYAKLHYNDLGEPHADVYKKGTFFSSISLTIPGEFNIQNAMGALVVADLSGAKAPDIEKALKSFRGAEGRFTRVGQYNGAHVIIDYAHHPSAVRVTV